MSVQGGDGPVWARDGRQLFYWQGRVLVAATLAFDPLPRVVSRERLFEGDYQESFDVAADGMFLMIESERSGRRLVVVPNWRTELRRLTSGARR